MNKAFEEFWTEAISPVLSGHGDYRLIKNIASIAYEAGRKSALKERDADDNPLKLARHPQQ